MPSTTHLALALATAAVVYTVGRAVQPFWAIYTHLRTARTVGLPIKILPVPQGLFSFFAFQVLKRLGLCPPGSALEKIFNVGRPDGYGMHDELGDSFLTVSALGIGLVTADPKVASYVNAHRQEFPKPPNTGAIINLYGRNVINTRGDQWRFHRRVTGPVFSERIHRAVWDEATRQAGLMLAAWKTRASAAQQAAIPLEQLEDDSLRLGLHVITGAAYGVPLGWDEDPPTAVAGGLSYRRSLEELTKHLMPLFLSPRWALRLAPRGTTWGDAWHAYECFGGYMRGMLDRARRLREEEGDAPDAEENLMSVLVRAQEEEDEKEGKKMTEEEVMGNAFIFLFAGHETTANTLHYALLLLAMHPHIQSLVQQEIDSLGPNPSYDVFPSLRWLSAVFHETLRCYSPTSMVNKWTDAPTPVPFGTRTVVLPPQTRVSVNVTGVHASPKVWGADAAQWRPERWVVGGVGGGEDLATPALSLTGGTPLPSPLPSPLGGAGKDAFLKIDASARVNGSHHLLPTPPPTPGARLSPTGSPPPPPSLAVSPTATTTTPASPSGPAAELLKPAKGTFLPFSEGARQCSGRKFAAVEFAAVLSALLREHTILPPDGWDEAEVWAVLKGRKAGALTLQPPKGIPVRLVPRRV